MRHDLINCRIDEVSVLQLLPFALGVELTVVGYQSLQALLGISDRTCNTEIVGEAFEHECVAAWCQWNVRIFAPDFVHIGIVVFRRRSIRNRNIPYDPTV